MVDLKTLIKAGVYFGHRTSTWSPKMKPYIWGKKGEICLIDVSKTAIQMEKAARFLEDIVSQGKSVLWIGTKKPAQAVVKEVAAKLGACFVTHRWIGGTLTNNSQVKKSVAKLLHFKDILEKADKFPYTKKERNSFMKMAERLSKNVGGIKDLKLPLGAVVIVDIAKEHSALKEAVLEKIPVIGLVDTNCDPSLVDIVVPCNDDSPRSIKVVLDYLSQAVERGNGKQKELAAEGAEDKVDADKDPKKVAAKKVEEPKKAVAKKVEEPKKAVAKKAEEPKKAVAKKVEEPKKAAAKGPATEKKVVAKKETEKEVKSEKK
jgi:small subunit ribosomal protein S2